MKLKTVTIIHSATTETVRLPDDGNNGVIVHTALRTKVPLKKKVRGERKKNQQKSSSTPVQKESNAAANSATRKPTLNVANRQIVLKESPRKVLHQNNKKKRSQNGEGDEQSQQVPKAPRRTKGSLKSKEIIDYSNPQQHLNTFGKVQKWLLESPIVASATSQFEHVSKTPTTTMMNKSQSNPENLTNPQHKQQHRSPINTSSKPKMKAMNNKMRLQVVFKPPFKFSLKLSKNENGGEKNNESNRRQDSRKRNSIDNQVMPKRAALLIRSNIEESIDEQSKGEFIIQEPMYETLNSKIISSHRQKSSAANSNAPNYENLPTTSSTANLIDATLNNSFSSPINTATFRVNKSSSGNNITNKNLPVISTPVLRNSSNATNNASHRENQKRRLSASNSSSNLIKFGGSSQNLTRSSTTNLTKNNNSSSRHDGIKRRASDMNRSSTTNLSKNHRHNTSNSNLRRGDSYVDVSNEDRNSTNEKKSHSRKSSLSKSNSNLANASVNPQTGSSRRNNIPRASLINSTIANALSNTPFQRQISFNFKPTPLSTQSRELINELNKNRPQTSSCDSSMFKNFEWPRVLSTQRSLPADNVLQSDMEVMVSDGETLENDS